MFVKCDCNDHALEFWHWNDKHDEFPVQTFVAIWQLGRSSEILTWRDRIRWCWHILKTGKPWNDSVILSEEGRTKIIEYLSDDQFKG